MARYITDYKVVLAQNIVDLETEVNKLCDEGWEPQGGIFWIVPQWCQAMVNVRA